MGRGNSRPVPGGARRARGWPGAALPPRPPGALEPPGRARRGAGSAQPGGGGRGWHSLADEGDAEGSLGHLLGDQEEEDGLGQQHGDADGALLPSGCQETRGRRAGKREAPVSWAAALRSPQASLPPSLPRGRGSQWGGSLRQVGSTGRPASPPPRPLRWPLKRAPCALPVLLLEGACRRWCWGLSWGRGGGAHIRPGGSRPAPPGTR